MLLSKTQTVLRRRLVLTLVISCTIWMFAQSDRLIEFIKSHEIWKMTGIGELKAHDGTDLDSFSYTNQDGIGATIIRGSFDSDKQSVTEIKEEIKNAKEILEHTFRKDESGKTVGERFVVVFQEKESEPD